MTAATDPSTLPQWKNHPVPWVTRWTGEVDSTAPTMSLHRGNMQVHLRYPDGNEDRDDHGVLWKREGILRGGEPQFSELNTYRQRASMNKRLCQVCGKKINARLIRWVVGRRQLIDFENEEMFAPSGNHLPGEFGTISPPTCDACIPLATTLCPYLKKEGYAILKVLEYERWGVMGQAVELDVENERYRDHRGAYLSYVNPTLPLTAIVAYQQCVKFTKAVFEKGFTDE
jgi:hypothetical protein